MLHIRRLCIILFPYHILIGILLLFILPIISLCLFNFLFFGFFRIFTLFSLILINSPILKLTPLYL